MSNKRRTRNVPLYTLAQERLLTSMLRRATVKLEGSGEKSWSRPLVTDGLILVEGDVARLTDAGRVIADRLDRGERFTRLVELGASQ